MNENITLGKKIAKLRKEKGYTQEEFSELLSITPQAVSKWENDLSCPDVMLLPKIAELLGVSVDELLSGKKGNVTSAVSSDNNKNIKQVFRLRVINPDAKSPVNITLPLSFVKKAIKIGNGISGILGKNITDEQQIENISELIVNGATGEILNITDENGVNVIIEII